MAASELISKRFLDSTRGRIVALLRRGHLTVEELATSVGLTDNAVRAHLTTLERDGLVRQIGVRRGGPGKPAYTYEIAPEAEPLFSNAYIPLLTELLRVLADRLPPEELERAMRDAGRRLAADRQLPTGDLRARVEAAAALLAELGGVTDIEGGPEGYAIRGRGCPVSTIVHANPVVCRAVETLLAEVTGADVQERCDRGARARCIFHVQATS